MRRVKFELTTIGCISSLVQLGYIGSMNRLPSILVQETRDAIPVNLNNKPTI